MCLQNKHSAWPSLQLPVGQYQFNVKPLALPGRVQTPHFESDSTAGEEGIANPVFLGVAQFSLPSPGVFHLQSSDSPNKNWVHWAGRTEEIYGHHHRQ